MPPTPLLSLENLSTHYVSQRGSRVVRAVDDVTFSLSAGETLGIVGESGSGKSTVARCIARLIDPTEGKVYLGDTEIATMPAGKLRPHRRRVQIVFQDPYLSMNPRITGVGMKLATHPMRISPKTKKKQPIRTASVEVSELNSALPWAAIAPTVTAEISPVAVSGPTTSCREVPSSAYTSNGGTIV